MSATMPAGPAQGAPVMPRVPVITRLSPTIQTRRWLAGRDNVRTDHEHWCPGCNALHQIAVDQPFRNGARWTFDDNAEAPTFSPSVNNRVGPFPDGTVRVCHYFIRAGRIEFCGDSTHALSGQTVDLPPIPEGRGW